MFHALESILVPGESMFHAWGEDLLGQEANLLGIQRIIRGPSGDHLGIIRGESWDHLGIIRGPSEY